MGCLPINKGMHEKIDPNVEGTPLYPISWYDWHPHTRIFNSMDASLPCEKQYEIAKSIDYREEQPQVDTFCSLLKTIVHENPTMIEVGTQGLAGSFYSVLFEKWFCGKCKIINVEPVKYLLDEVRIVWKNKHLTNAHFYHGYVGTPKHYGAPVTFSAETAPHIKMIDLMLNSGVDKLDVLHADIQGSEISLCEELKEYNLMEKIRYFFISTHEGDGGRTYEPCLQILSSSMNCKLHYSSPTSGGWGDGLIVAENLDYA